MVHNAFCTQLLILEIGLLLSRRTFATKRGQVFPCYSNLLLCADQSVVRTRSFPSLKQPLTLASFEDGAAAATAH